MSLSRRFLISAALVTWALPAFAKAPEDVPRFPSLGPRAQNAFRNQFPRASFSPRMFPQTWSSPGEFGTNDSYSDGQPDIQVDTEGTPWIIWRRKPRSSSIPTGVYWSRWTGGSWSLPQKINTVDNSTVYKPKFAFAQADTAWLVWHTQSDHDIWFIRGYGGSWFGAAAVNPPSGSMDYYSPEISIGGGQVWLTWYGAVGSDPFNVFVTHWNGLTWEVPTNLTNGFPGYNWFADIAADDSGTPHVVWGDYYSGRIYYATLSNGHWSPPMPLNDPTIIEGGVWPAPQIIAKAGRLFVVWVGRKFVPGVGFGDQDIFYSEFSSGQWHPPIQVNTDDLTDEYYPVICVRNSSEMWIAWDNDETSGAFGSTAWVTQFNGTTALGQSRLDAGRFYYNELPRLSLDSFGLPWAAWDGVAQDFSDDGIFYSHFAPITSVTDWHFTYHVSGNGVQLQWDAGAGDFLEFEVARASSQTGNFEVIGVIYSTGGNVYTWLDKPSSSGEYWYRVSAINRNGEREVLGPIAVRLENLERLSLALKTPFRSDIVKVQVGSPIEGTVKFDVWDVNGRLVGSLGERNLEKGWQEVVFAVSANGRRLGYGIYFLTATGLGQLVSTRIIKLP